MRARQIANRGVVVAHLSGAARLDFVPFRAQWRLPYAPALYQASDTVPAADVDGVRLVDKHTRQTLPAVPAPPEVAAAVGDEGCSPALRGAPRPPDGDCAPTAAAANAALARRCEHQHPGEQVYTVV